MRKTIKRSDTELPPEKASWLDVSAIARVDVTSEDSHYPRRSTKMSIINVELLKLGLRIKASRKMLGRSQKEFASQCALDRSFFVGVERGERNMTFTSLCQICTGLHCDIAAVTKGIPYGTEAPN